MEIRIARAKLWPIMAAAALPTALLGLALTFASGPVAAQQWTPEQRAACQGDAQRLCGQYVPDVDRITACMSQKRRYLSPGCRAVFSGGAKRKH